MSWKNCILVFVLIVFTSSLAFAVGPIEDYSSWEYEWSGQPGDDGSMAIPASVNNTTEDASLHIWATSNTPNIVDNGHYYLWLGTAYSSQGVAIMDSEFEQFGNYPGTVEKSQSYARNTWDESVFTWASNPSYIVVAWGFTIRFSHLPINLD